MKQSKRKLLIFSDCPFFAGCENVIVTILKSPIIQNDYEIHFVYRYSKTYQEGLDKRLPQQLHFHPTHLSGFDIMLHQINVRFGHNLWLRRLLKIPLFLIKKTGIFSLYNYFKLKTIFKKIAPDILYINNGGYPAAPNCITAVFSGNHAGISTIFFNVNNMALKPLDPLSKLRDKYVEKYVANFITASYSAKKRLSQVRGFSLDDIVNIPNTIEDFERPTSKLKSEYNITNEIVIGGAGLLTERKGFHILVEAISMLKFTKPFKVIIFGEGEDQIKLENIISEYQLGEYIILAGFKSDILSYVVDFDIFTLPSTRNEDFPYAIVEAMALGKPVLSTYVAGIPEAVQDGKTGFVVNPSNPKQLASKLDILLNDSDKRTEFGKNGRERFLQNYQYDIICQQYLNLFQRKQ